MFYLKPANCCGSLYLVRPLSQFVAYSLDIIQHLWETFHPSEFAITSCLVELLIKTSYFLSQFLFSEKKKEKHGKVISMESCRRWGRQKIMVSQIILGTLVAHLLSVLEILYCHRKAHPSEGKTWTIAFSAILLSRSAKLTLVSLE